MRRNLSKSIGLMFSAKSLKMINFCKNPSCPSSPELLAFQKGEFTNKDNEIIRTHLNDCEFCAVETEFYARFPQAEEECAETNIPAPLYQLAEALLGNRQKKSTSFQKLLGENESLKLETA